MTAPAPQTRPHGTPPTRRAPQHVFEVEDVLLALWLGVLEYGIRRAAGNDLVGLVERLDLALMEWTWNTPHAWLAAPGMSIKLIATAVMIPFGLVVFTRGPEDTDRDVALSRRFLLLGPFYYVLSIYALVASGVQQLLFGHPPLRDGQQPPWPGPWLPSGVRRTLVLPAALFGESVFREISATIVRDGAYLDLRSVALQVLLSVLPFAILVAAPRIVAGASMHWRTWVPRFALFYAAWWWGLLTAGWW